jgi:hypothetical protein
VELPVKSLQVALLFLVMVSGSALAQSDAVAPQTENLVAQSADDDDEEFVVEGEVPKEKRKICEMRTSTGSIVPKRVCRTVAQIEEDERLARDAMERVNRDRETRDTIQANRGPGV